MDKPTAEDTSEEIKHVNIEKTNPAEPLKPKSEYSQTERRTIYVGLIVLALIFVGAVYFLLERTNNQPLETPAETETGLTSEQTSQLDKVELQQVSNDGMTSSFDYIVFFSDAIEHFVPVPPISDSIYFANIVKTDSSAQVDEELLVDELKDELLDESFEVYSPDKPEISANDEASGIRRYQNATIYCTIQFVNSTVLDGMGQTAQISDEQTVGYVKKMCADESELRYTVARLQEFYDIALGDSELLEDTEYDPTILVLDSGTRLSPIDGYEYKEGTEAIVGSTAASDIAFVRFEQQDWQAFRFDGLDTISCNEFDTELVQKALASNTCTDPDTDAETTVGNYYNLL